MQKNRALKVVILVLSLICLYELSFTYITKKIETDLLEEADHNYDAYNNLLKEKESEEVWMGYTYLDCKKREINLGLDLRGGVSVTLEISMDELVKSMIGENVKNPYYVQVAAKAAELQKNSQESYVDLFYKAYKEVGPKQPFASWFISRNNDFTPQTTDEQVLEKLREYSNEAIDQANEVLRSRVKQFGIAQPDIRKLGASGRIMVDLPGVKDLKRVRGLLQGSANLEFWDVYSWVDLRKEAEVLADAYDLTYNESAKKDTSSKDSTAKKDAPVNTGFMNPFLTIGMDNPYSVTVLTTDTQKINSFFKKESNAKLLPKNSKFAWESAVRKSDAGDEYISFYILKPNRYGKAQMEGDIIKYARPDFDPNNGGKIVSLDFKASEVQNWELITKKSFEERKPIAIVLDGIVFSAPVASSVISNGSTMITGGSRDAEYWNADLANVLNAGKFPAPAKIVEESFVGPSLGAQSIQAGVVSFIVAFLIILVYMVFFYNRAGWVANVALIANVFFIFGALAAAPTLSLTLPGIAGIVLTLGMSVDANVIIYERIKGELREGKSMKTAIANGFKFSYSSILDANVTTLITGFILWYFGTGVIESFAQTLVIGIFSSLFAAIFVSRVIFDWLLDKDKTINFSTSMTDKFLVGTKIKFMANRKKFYMLSGVIIVIGLISIFTKKFDLGTDFSGGRTYKVQFDKNVNDEEVRDALSKVFLDPSGKPLSPEVKTYGDNSSISVTTKYLYEDQSKDASVKVEQKLYEGLKSYLPANMDFQTFSAQVEGKKVGLMQSYTVGPTVADDIIQSAIVSVFLALIAIFIYIAVRFRKWQLGVGALIALFHDVLIVASLFSIFYGIIPFSLEINQAFIAAILTVVGYSINDTVIIFDRIREVLGGKRSQPLPDLVDYALNDTLTRTLNTSFTSAVVLVAILIFGGESIQGFAFAMLTGIIVGTYSSICIASPIFVDLEAKKSE